MKDLEKLLSSHTPKPTRQLNDNFTQSVLSGIQDTQNMSLFTKMQHAISSRFKTKAGLAVAASLVLFGGTAAAIALWPTPTVTTTESKLLPSGNHIVGYNTTNCMYFGTTKGSLPKTKESVYYEVRQGSKLTDDQLQRSLQAVCEENISNNAMVEATKVVPKTNPGVMSTMAYRVDVVNATSITVSLDPQYDAAQYTVVSPLTYSHFSKPLTVRDRYAEATYADIKVGDTIKMLVQDTSGKAMESAEPYQPLNHPEDITIWAIVKIPALTGDPTLFYNSVATDLVRVETCSQSATGFCRAYEFGR